MQFIVTYFTQTFLLFLTILIILCAIVICNKFNKLFVKMNTVCTEIENISRASKRIERMSDAVNQRTKAHLIAKESVKSKKTNNSDKNKPKAKQNKRVMNHKKDNKNGSTFKYEKTSYSDTVVDYD